MLSGLGDRVLRARPTVPEVGTQPASRMTAEPSAEADGAAAAWAVMLNPAAIGGVLFLIVLLFMVGIF
nr:hypothetical protein [uncultured Lichenicoccus sp.]